MLPKKLMLPQNNVFDELITRSHGLWDRLTTTNLQINIIIMLANASHMHN